MTDTDPQAPEVSAIERTDDVSQSLVPGVSATLFQPQGSDRQIQLVVCNQYLFGSNAEIMDYRRHGLPTSVHKGYRLKEP